MITYNRVRKKIESTFYPYFDFRTARHIVVFESDDWGSIRMSTRAAWDALLKQGYDLDKRRYERYDTLESAKDLEALFDVLRKHQDNNGNHPVITANMLMVNPDFQRIEQSGYKQYYYEPITNTYTKYYGDTSVLSLMRQGMDEGLFMPQCHGREHFNVSQWLRGLQAGDKDLLVAFKYGMCGIAPKEHSEKGNQLMNALLANNENEQESIDAIVAEGLNMFEKMWGFKSRTFVAPCYLWNTSTEKVLSDGGVQLIQTSRIGKSAYQTRERCFYSGKRNRYNQLYSVRNCKYEPSTNNSARNTDALMKQIDDVFAQHKLAVFSTHRINYVGGIDETNRSRTLTLLDVFLTKLQRRYPDVEFLSSDKLIDVIR